MRTIAVINQKGGVGKTTTVASLGAAIATAGRDVCVIDLDPQAHLTLSLGVEPGTPKASMYEVLTTSTPIDEATVQIAERFWLVPSVIDLAAAEVELVGAVGREQIMRDQLLAMPKKFDYVMIDCPPSLGLLTLNALAAADDVIIPLQPHFLALQGLGKLLETISLVQRRINTGLRVRGVILCMYESSTKLAAEVVADLRNFFDSGRNTNVPWSDAIIFESAIRRNIKLAECPSYGKTIFDYEPKSNGAGDYKALAQEFFRMYDNAGLSAVPAAEPLAPISPAEQQQQVPMHVHVPQAQVQPPPASADEATSPTMCEPQTAMVAGAVSQPQVQSENDGEPAAAPIA